MSSYHETVGVVGWLRHWSRALLAEVLSTALLMWLGCAPLVPITTTHVPLSHPAFAFGFIVVANICAFGEASGAHMNPAITLGALVYGELKVLPALGYVTAQLLGAVIGFGGLMITSPGGLITEGVAATLPAEGVTPLAAMVTEAVLTGMLMLAVCGVWAAHDPEHPDRSAPLKIGVVVTGLVYSGGFITGASINPARSFAPALLQGYWRHHWVYWVGRLLGGAVGALVHRCLLNPRRITSSYTNDGTPLRDKP